MKKFSTATLILAFLAATSTQALADDKKCTLRADAPETHTVVKGDTLWGISGKFLERPWCWPDVWGMNREQIRNPHWIFPGQVIYIDRATGKLRLGTPSNAAQVPYVATKEKEPTDARMRPYTRIKHLDKEALPSIDAKLIEPFLSQALIVDEDQIKSAPYIVGTIDGRVKLGKGDRAYVRGNLQGKTVFNVFQPAEPLRDPITQKVIAYEAVHLGTVQMVRTATTPSEAHSFNVLEASKEMAAGDRLLPKPPHSIVNYVPHAPEKPIDARIVSIYRGVSVAGKGQVVSLNRGASHGMAVGDVLNTYHAGEVIKDPVKNGWFGSSAVKLPDEVSGTVFVFRVFKNVSYALIMEANNIIAVGDAARSPQ